MRNHWKNRIGRVERCFAARNCGLAKFYDVFALRGRNLNSADDWGAETRGCASLQRNEDISPHVASRGYSSRITRGLTKLPHSRCLWCGPTTGVGLS